MILYMFVIVHAKRNLPHPVFSVCETKSIIIQFHTDFFSTFDAERDLFYIVWWLEAHSPFLLSTFELENTQHSRQKVTNPRGIVQL